MSILLALRCDRCTKESVIPSSEKKDRADVYPSATHYPGFRPINGFDLCSICWSDYAKAVRLVEQFAEKAKDE